MPSIITKARAAFAVPAAVTDHAAIVIGLLDTFDRRREAVRNSGFQSAQMAQQETKRALARLQAELPAENLSAAQLERLAKATDDTRIMEETLSDTARAHRAANNALAQTAREVRAASENLSRAIGEAVDGKRHELAKEAQEALRMLVSALRALSVLDDKPYGFGMAPLRMPDRESPVFASDIPTVSAHDVIVEAFAGPMRVLREARSTSVLDAALAGDVNILPGYA